MSLNEFSDLSPSIANLTNPSLVGTMLLNGVLTLFQLPRVFQLIRSMKKKQV